MVIPNISLMRTKPALIGQTSRADLSSGTKLSIHNSQRTSPRPREIFKFRAKVQ